MSMWTAIFLIVAMSLIASTIRHGISSKAQASESDIADLKAEFEAGLKRWSGLSRIRKMIFAGSLKS